MEVDSETATVALGSTAEPITKAKLVSLSNSSSSNSSDDSSSNASMGKDNSSTTPLQAPIDGSAYPTRRLGAYDNATDSCGLMVHYKLSEPHDTCPVDFSDLLPPLAGITVDLRSFYQHAVSTIASSPKLLTADTLMVIVDTRAPDKIDHFQHVARCVLERTWWVGPKNENWHAAYFHVPDNLAHFTWASVFIAEVLAILLPGVNLVLLDNDATPTTLYEIHELTQLASALTLPYLHAPEHFAMITASEKHSTVNAGIVTLPAIHSSDATEPLFHFASTFWNDYHSATTPVQKEDLYTRFAAFRALQHNLLRTRKHPLPTQPYKSKEEALSGSMPFDYIKPGTQEKRKLQTALEWNLEHERGLLRDTPYYRSAALSRNDVLHAWTHIGEIIHKVAYPPSFLNKKEAYVGNLAPLAQQREDSLGNWAGPCFEQTVLQALHVLQTPTLGIVNLPGHKLFMEPYVPDQTQFMPAMNTHAFGKAKAQLRQLNTITTWYTMREALAPLLIATSEGNSRILLPMILSPEGVNPCPGAHADPRNCTNPVTAAATNELDTTWKKRNDPYPQACGLLLAYHAAHRSQWRAMERPTPFTNTTTQQVASTGVNSTAPDAPMDSPLPSPTPACPTPPDSSATPSKINSIVQVICPGVGWTDITGDKADLLLTNPDKRRATYGPTARNIEEQDYNYVYQMPLASTPTLQGFRVLMADKAILQEWKASIGAEWKEPQPLALLPLPSFLHLPATEYIICAVLLLLQYSPQPAVALGHLLQKAYVAKTPPLWENPTTIQIKGYSAGSYTGMLVYRIVQEFGSTAGLKLGKSGLGALAFHPIMFYDFHLHDSVPPLLSTKNYADFNHICTLRPLLLHCINDTTSSFMPSNDEAQGIITFNYRLILVKLTHKQLDQKIYGYNCHSYAHLLTDLDDLSTIPCDCRITDFNIQQALEDKGLHLLATLIAMLKELSVRGFAKWINSLLTVAPAILSRDPPELAPQDLPALPKTRTPELAAHFQDQLFLALSTLPKPMRAWALFLAVPESFLAGQPTSSDKETAATQLTPYYCTAEELSGLIHIIKPVAKQVAVVQLEFTEKAWAIFQNTSGKEIKGFHIGEIVECQINSREHNVLQLVGLVLSKESGHSRSERKNKSGEQSDIQSVTILANLSVDGEDPTAIASDRHPTHHNLLQLLNSSPRVDVLNWTRYETKACPREWNTIFQIPATHFATMMQPTNILQTIEPLRRNSPEIYHLLYLLTQHMALFPKNLTADQIEDFYCRRHRIGIDALPEFDKEILRTLQISSEKAGLPQHTIFHSTRFKSFPWLYLVRLSPAFASDLLLALRDPEKITLTLFVHLALHTIESRQTCLVHGVVGAGKTFSMGMYAFLLSTTLGKKFFWSCHTNQPLEEGSKSLSRWINSANPQIYTALLKTHVRACAQQQTSKHSADLSYVLRISFDFHHARVLLMTGPALAKALNFPYSELRDYLKQNLHMLIIDEGQQFGSTIDAWLLAQLDKEALVTIVGDDRQPVGAGSTRALQLLLELRQQLKPGLRCKHIKRSAPRRYCQNLTLTAPDQSTEQTPQTIEAALALLMQGYKLNSKHTLEEYCGWSNPGCLLLPASARLPEATYQLVTICGYPENVIIQSRPANKHVIVLPTNPEQEQSTSHSGSHQHAEHHSAQHQEPPSLAPPGLADLTPCTPQEQNVNIGVSCSFEAFTMSQRCLCKNLDLNQPYDLAHANTKEQLRSDGCRLLGTYILPTVSHAASSRPPNRHGNHNAYYEWLEETKNQVINSLALFIFASARDSHDISFNLGFFCPWLNVLQLIDNHFGVSQWLKAEAKAAEESAKGKGRSKNKYGHVEPPPPKHDTLLDAVLYAANATTGSLTLHDVHYILNYEPQTIAPYLTLRTSIAGASANVRHAITLVSRHTSFTAQFAQSLVATSRIQGVNLVFAPPTPLRGFLRLFIPSAIKLTATACPLLQNPVSIYEALQSTPVALSAKLAVTNALLQRSPIPTNPTLLPLGFYLHTGLAKAPTTMGCETDAGVLHPQCADNAATAPTTLGGIETTSEPCIMQLMISATWAPDDCPDWATPGNSYMWSWRQVPIPPRTGPAEQEPPYWLMQLSTKTKVKILTIYLCQGRKRTPVAGFTSNMLTKNNPQPDIKYATNYNITLQELDFDVLLGTQSSDYTELRAHLPAPITTELPEPNEEPPNNDEEEDEDEPCILDLLRAHVYKYATSHPRGEELLEAQKSKGNVQGNDFEERNDDEQDIRPLQSFIQESIDNKGPIMPPDLWKPFTHEITCAVGWGIIRISIDRVFSAFCAALLQRFIVQDTPDAGNLFNTKDFPSAEQLQQAYISYVAQILVHILVPLIDCPLLKADCVPTSAYDRFFDHAFWTAQLNMALNYAEVTKQHLTPPAALLLRATQRKISRELPSTLNFSPETSIRIFTTVNLILPVQLTLWMAAHLHELLPDEDSYPPEHDVRELPNNQLFQTFKARPSKPKPKNTPSTTMERENPFEKITIGKFVLCSQGPPYWPRDNHFPAQITCLQQSKLDNFKKATKPTITVSRFMDGNGLIHNKLAFMLTAASDNEEGNIRLRPEASGLDTFFANINSEHNHHALATALPGKLIFDETVLTLQLRNHLHRTFPAAYMPSSGKFMYNAGNPSSNWTSRTDHSSWNDRQSTWNSDWQPRWKEKTSHGWQQDPPNVQWYSEPPSSSSSSTNWHQPVGSYSNHAWAQPTATSSWQQPPSPTNPPRHQRASSSPQHSYPIGQREPILPPPPPPQHRRTPSHETRATTSTDRTSAKRTADQASLTP